MSPRYRFVVLGLGPDSLSVGGRQHGPCLSATVVVVVVMVTTMVMAWAVAMINHLALALWQWSVFSLRRYPQSRRWDSGTTRVPESPVSFASMASAAVLLLVLHPFLQTLSVGVSLQ